MTAKYSTILLLFVSLLLSGCGNNIVPAAVAAAPPPKPPIDICASGFASGIYGGAESPGSSISLVNCPGALRGDPFETDTQTLNNCGKSQVVKLSVTQDFHVHTVRLWMGAGKGSQFENGVCLEILSSTGAVLKTFRNEWDKHVEEHYKDEHFPVDFIIPSGSIVRLSRDPHGTISCNDAPGNDCLTQEMAELN